MNRLKRIIPWLNESTQRKLIFWSIAFWVISVSIVSLVILWVGQNQMLQDARQRNLQLASLISRDINAQLASIFDNTRIFTQHLEAINPEIEAQATALLGLRLSSPQYNGVYYFDTQNSLLFQITDNLQSLLNVKDSREFIGRPQTEIQPEVNSVYQAVGGHNIFVSDVVFAPVDYSPMLYIGMPVELSSSITRIVIYRIDLSSIWQKINITTVGQTGIIYAVSHEGLIIAHPEPACIGLQIANEITPVLSSSEGVTDYYNAVTRSEVIASYSPVGGPTGWGIVVEQDMAEAYSSITRTGTVIFLIWIALGLIGTLSIVLLIRTYTRPIKQLTATAQKIARTGTLTKTGMEKSHDEIGQLSAAFDQMIERLGKSEDRLAHVAAEERNRLARDLHDAVSQTLFSASLIAEVLPRLWDRNPVEGRKRLEEVRQLTRGALAEMRTLLLELRPASLVEAEMSNLLHQLGESITGRSRIPVTVTIEGECALPNEAKVALYRISQEALNNVAKHSGATSAGLTLICRPEQVTLTVSDNGKGFDVAANSTRSLGLGIIRERAKEIGASLSIQSRPGAGTTINVTWKIPNA